MPSGFPALLPSLLLAALALVLPLRGDSVTSSDRAGVPFDLQGFVNRELAKGNRTVTIPPGRYRVTPKNHQHLVLRDLADVTIVALDVEMVCTETTRALTLQNCRNVTLRGLTIDYDPLPFTQGRITALSADKRVHEIELFEGYPGSAKVVNFKYEIFRSDTRTLRTHDYGIEKLEKVDDRHLRLTKSGGRTSDLEQIGDLIVIGHEDAPGGQIPHAVEIGKCFNVRLEDVTLYASNCFGFIETECDATTYLRCRIDRCPPERDLRARASDRLRSLNADAYHSKHAVKGPQLLGCVARFMGDDAVNICGDYHLVAEGSGDTYRVLAKGTLFKEGDLLELFTHEGLRLADTKVVKIVADGEINESERETLLKQEMDQGLRTKWKPKAYRVTLEHAVPLTPFSVVASTRAVGNGFLVKDCQFGWNRSRGILIKASEGEVSGNTVEGSRMAGILVAPEYWWLEAGSSNHLVIKDNTLRDVGGTAISVEARAGNGKTAPSGAHNGITISGNTVSGSPLPQIRVESTAGLVVEGNHLTPFVAAPAASGRPSIETPNCEKPVVR